MGWPKSSPPKNSPKISEPRLNDFEAWGKRLLLAYRKASDKEPEQATVRPRKRAMNAFKLTAYRYYRDLQQANLIDALQAYVISRDGNQWNGRGARGELWIMRLVTSGDQTDQKRQLRRRLAAELRLAAVNDVQPDLLLGFLYEAGPAQLIERDAKREARYKWADCYRKSAAPKRPSKQPAGKQSQKSEDAWE